MISKISNILSNNKMTISVAGNYTSSKIQSLLSSSSRLSEHYEGGIITNNINQKVKHLKVSRKLTKDLNKNSPKIVKQMALGASNLFETRVSLSTTGKLTDQVYYSIMIYNKT